MTNRDDTPTGIDALEPPKRVDTSRAPTQLDFEPIQTPSAPSAPLSSQSALGWMASNSVAANLLMLFLLVGGLVGLLTTKQEVFPEFELDLITVSVPYPGASPFEVEQGIVLAVEERIRGIDGVKRVSSSSGEGSGHVYAELLRDADSDQALADIKAEVDRIQTFPAEAEEPIVSIAKDRRQVVSLIISADQDLQTLHELAEQARADLLRDGKVTQVDVSGLAPLEISVEISRESLQRYGLTLEGVAQTIRGASLELAAGGVDTPGGEVLLRVADRRRRGHELRDIVLAGTAQGGELRLGDIATIRDGFEEQDRYSYYNGRPAVRVTAYRVGDETPSGVSKVVNAYVKELKQRLPESIEVTTWDDDSEILDARIDLLTRNAVMGFFLVIGILALFLDLRLALWVALGIPISFLGSFLMLGSMDVSINMVSLFAFIVTLGMVVDDAIVVGERIYSLVEEGLPAHRAAITAAHELLAPVTFAILTSVVAFAPMFFVPGVMGKIFRVLPAVVISVLLISLVESFLILPAHLSHSRGSQKRKYLILKIIGWLQDRVAWFLEFNIQKIYDPVLRVCLRFRYIAVSVAVALMLVTLGWVASGYVPFNFFPKLAGDIVVADVQLPYGAPLQETREAQRKLERALQKTLKEFEAEDALRGSFTRLGSGNPAHRSLVGKHGSHLVGVEAAFVPSDERGFDTQSFGQAWLKNIPSIPRAESVEVTAEMGPGAGEAVALQLTHPDNEVLAQISSEVEVILAGFSELNNIKNQYSSGKPQFSYQLRPEAKSLGLSANEVARQLRSAFYGAESIREQRGRNEIRIVTRLPPDERRSEYDLEQMRIRTPQGGEVPLREVVELKRGRSATAILREDGRRTITVSGELADGIKSPRPVLDALKGGILDKLREKHPRLEIEFVGAQREQADAFRSLGIGQGLALLVIYGLLAIPFRSYIQPAVVMAVIPFGVVGAVLGHIYAGYSLSIISAFGIVALSGVVVNDSIVLIDAVNRRRAAGDSAFDAIITGGKARFRPILLTSLTTYFGLVPMLAESSVQARFLIPMAVSLGYGILFATVVVLVLVPAIYMIVEDLQAMTKSAVAFLADDED